MSCCKISKIFCKTDLEELDYQADWSSWLTEEVIIASQWIVDDPAVVIETNFKTDTGTTVWLSGGVLGDSYTVTNTITTSAPRPRIASRAFLLRIRSR